MLQRLKQFLVRHPLVRDAILWAIPAILFGAFLRVLLLQLQPYAYFGSDSKSYYSFTNDLLERGKFGLYDKRRYLYLLFCFPVSLLPGAALAWLAWIQHALGLASLVPLAYSIRKSFVSWRWMIIPATVFYAGIPMVFWYEHELLAETLLFDMVIWTVAGWMAWVSQTQVARARLYWWWFFVPLAAAMLTKPSVKFFLPGLGIALLAVRFWRIMDRRKWISAVAVFALSLSVGQESQGVWLQYVSAFPLTRLDTPKHAEYKAQIKDLVERLRARLDVYYLFEEEAFEYLEKPARYEGRPLWAALDKDSKEKDRIYRDLTREAILTQPHLYLYIAIQRLAVSSNLSEFKDSRFTTTFYPSKFQSYYELYAKEKPGMLRRLFGLPKNKPLPSFEEFSPMLSGAPDGLAARFLQPYVQWFHRTFDFFVIPENLPREQRTLWRFKVLPLSWLLVGGCCIAFALPCYHRKLGWWVVVLGSYMVGVFLVGTNNARYFGTAWPVMTLLLALPLDVLITLLRGRARDLLSSPAPMGSEAPKP